MKAGHFLILLFQILVISSSAQVSGTVFRDFNGNGTKDNSATYNEPFVSGVVVKAYNTAGTEVGSTTSNASGAYSFTGLTLPLRIEFSSFQSGDYSAPVGSGSTTSVQFYSSATTTANFGLNYPDDYWDNTKDPRYVVPQHVNGLKTGNAGSVAGIVSTPLSSTGLNANHDDDNGVFGTGPIVRDDILTSEIGTVWGEAYYKQGKQMYFSTFLKRHCDLGDGLGYIYSYNYSGSGVPTFTAKFNLQGVVPANGGSAIDFGNITRTGSADYTLPTLKEDPNIDLDVFGKVATMSYGDIDMQPGTGYLWAVNLYQKALIRMDVSNNPTTLPSNINQYILSNLPNYPTPINGELRPFGLGFHKGKGYLGVVNDASTGSDSDLKAYILQFDPNNIAAGFTEIFNFNPNIKKTTLPPMNNYHKWMNVYDNSVVYGTPPFRFWVQPVLSDINFDENNNMYVSFFDRFGHQVGAYNRYPISGSTSNMTTGAQGEILKACPTSSGWEIEGTGSCHPGTTEFIDDVGGDSNPESTEGGAAVLKGISRLISVAVDPHPQGIFGTTYFTSQGVNTYDLSNGQIANWYGIYNGDRPFFGKANGLGDLEFLTDPSPIEIGNRVWNDTNSNGIQDAGENPIQGVAVELRKSDGTLITSAITDVNGNYYFSNGTGTDAGHIKYGLTMLMPNNSYKVIIPNVIGGSKQSVLGTTSLTTANVGGAGQPDVRDSDGTLVGNNAEVTVMTTDIAVAGANNHTFDFGFGPAVCAITSISANPGTCNTATNQYTLTGQVTFTNPPSTGTLTVQITGGGSQVFTAPFTSPQSYSIAGQTADGASHTVTAAFSADPACTSNTTYTAPTSCLITGTCSCKEYIYLNEPELGAVLKFEVGSPVALTEVNGANGGTAPNQHWYPGLGATQLPAPHGLATDLNGNLYIGASYAPNSQIRQLNCDGVIAPVSGTTITSQSDLLTNMFSIGNTIYVTKTGGVKAYNSCTGTLVGDLCYNDSSGNPLPTSYVSTGDWTWGLSYNKVTQMVYGTKRGTGSTGMPMAIYSYTKSQLEAGIAGGSCINPLIQLGTSATINPGDKFLPTILTNLLGITSDNSGNIYVVGWSNAPNYSVILKYNSLGEFISMSTTQNNTKTTFGIVWSEDTNRLYLANFLDDPSVDCISAYDANSLSYLGTAAPNPNLPDNNTAKAIGIMKECCPVNLPSTITREVCGAVGTKFYLNEEAFDDCDGIVCGSSWVPVGTLTNMTFDACDNSVVVTGPGCGTFTLNIGAVVSTGCSAQSSTFTICNTLPSATVVAGPAGTCNGPTPNNDAVINITSVMNANQAGISTGATYTGPAYNGAGTINISGGTGTFTGLMHNTQYTVRIFNGSNDCFVDYTVTTPTVACCALAVMCTPQPQTNCSPINGSASVSVTGAIGTVTYLWSSGEMTSSISNKAAGTYTVTVTDGGVSGCTKTCQAVIANQANAPTCTISVNAQPTCANLTGGNITVVPSPAGTYTYNWSDIGSGSANRTGLTGGTYTVTVTNTTTNCTGVCNVTLNTPTNCCNINAIMPQNLVCLDNGTPGNITDNRIRFSANVTNTNTSLTSYNVMINGGTTITPNMNVPYGVTQFTLGPGTAGGGATFTVTVTDSATPGCSQTFQVIDPGGCNNTTPCPAPKCGTATIQVNNN